VGFREMAALQLLNWLAIEKDRLAMRGNLAAEEADHGNPFVGKLFHRGNQRHWIAPSREFVVASFSSSHMLCESSFTT
jgi:hypothetical protein